MTLIEAVKNWKPWWIDKNGNRKYPATYEEAISSLKAVTPGENICENESVMLEKKIKYARDSAEWNRGRIEGVMEIYKGEFENEDLYRACVVEVFEREQLADWLEELKQLREESKWIPVTWREATEDDTPYLDEYPIILTCPMPDDRQEILISDHGYVCTDVCQIDSQGYWLEGKGDWLDIDAWMPLPKAYEGKE